MAQRKSVRGPRSSLLWLVIILVLLLAIALASVVFVIGPERQFAVQATATAQAHASEVQRAYDAGVAFAAAGDWEKATEEFARVVALEPSYKDAAARLAEVKAKLTESAAAATAEAQVTATAQAEATAEAQANARATAVAAPTATAKTMEAHYEKGVGYINMGRWDEAKAELGQVFEVDPNYKEVQAKLVEVEAEIAKLTPTATPTPLATPCPTSTMTATPTPEPVAGATWLREKDGSVMVYVPAGEFIMGSEDGEDDEWPQHKVHLDAFYIDKYEVTNAQYKVCVDTGICNPPPSCNSSSRHESCDPIYGKSAYDDYPVGHVSWYDANVYCRWAGGRLPTEAEWEKAARGTDGRKYPWGNRWDANKVNSREAGPGDRTAVGTYPAGASPYGALDMAGNMWEWCQDWYDEDYYASSRQHDPQGPSSGEYRVFRGGSRIDDERNVRAANRDWFVPGARYDNFGFRCVSQSP